MNKKVFIYKEINNNFKNWNNEGVLRFFFDEIFKKVKKKQIFFTYNLDDWGFLFVYLMKESDEMSIKISSIDMKIYSINIEIKNKIIIIKNLDHILNGELINFLDIYNLNFIEIPIRINYFLQKKKKNIQVKKKWSYFFLRKKLFFKNNEFMLDFFEKKNLNNIEKFLIFFENYLSKNFDLSISVNNVSSLSGMLYSSFFSNFNNFKIIKKINDNIYLYVKESYYGGRCEIFANQYNAEKTYYFDFVGMYSQCMLENFPIDSGAYIYKNFNLKIPGFYDISFFSHNMEYPVLPSKSNNGKVFFSNGSNRGIYWYEEINLFLEQGGKIEEIHSGYVFTSIGKVFENLIKIVEKLKEKTENLILKKFLKKLINSMYGRFAFSKNNNKIAILEWNFFFENFINEEGIKKYKKINNFVVLEYDENLIEIKQNFININSYNSNIIYASIITSKARIKLYNSIIEVSKNHKPLYCDTDSLFFSSKKEIKKNKFKFSDFVKWNDKEIINSIFINNKSYILKYKNNSQLIINGVTKKKGNFNNIYTNFYLNKKYNKKTNIFSYNKRVFNKYKKKTRALLHINGMYV